MIVVAPMLSVFATAPAVLAFKLEDLFTYYLHSNSVPATDSIQQDFLELSVNCQIQLVSYCCLSGQRSRNLVANYCYFLGSYFLATARIAYSVLFCHFQPSSLSAIGSSLHLRQITGPRPPRLCVKWSIWSFCLLYYLRPSGQVHQFLDHRKILDACFFYLTCHCQKFMDQEWIRQPHHRQYYDSPEVRACWNSPAHCHSANRLTSCLQFTLELLLVFT